MKTVRWQALSLGVLCALAVLLATAASVRAGGPPATCTGDLSNVPSSVGTLSGMYSGNVTIDGACAVDNGPAVVNGDLTLSPGSTLVAAFSGGDLTVTGNILVKSGGTLILGCNPDSFPCFDDPDATTLGDVSGSLVALTPLGVVVHNTTVHHDAIVSGGGGGLTCDPVGAFAAFGSPAYTDFEDNAINGNVIVGGLRTCWFGSLRNIIGGNAVYSMNTAADPDAGEVLQNTVYGSLACFRNTPAVQFGDSGAAPNVVYGAAIGQCGFDVLKPDPYYDGGGLQPISVKG
jgi:hypothetical protein